MTREPQSTTGFTKAQLQALQKQLEGAVGSVAAAIDHIDRNPNDEPLYVFKSASLNTSLRMLLAFVRELDASVWASVAKKPYNESSRKTRVPKTKPVPRSRKKQS
jgi:hypothetical protein